MDACNGHGGQGGEAFDAWVQAHEAHNAWFSEWKKQSARAVRRFRDLARLLDASGVRPRAVHAPLVQGCAALGIDRWVIPAKLANQSWRDLLEPAHRPPLQAFGAWSAFLRKYGFGPTAEAAFRALERDTALVDVASVELEHAYRRLLVAAEQQTGESHERTRRVSCSPRTRSGSMSRGRRQDGCRSEVAASVSPTTATAHDGASAGDARPEPQPSEVSSGIVRKEDFDAQLAREAPPWHVVHAYLSEGQHREWVEAHARSSRAFAEVLAALRNDHEERREHRRRR